MTRYSHMWLGFATGVRVFGINHWTPEYVGSFFALMLGSIAPDLDVKIFGMSSKAYRDRTMFSHRGIFHHIALPILFYIFSFYFKNMGFMIRWFAIGYAVHLIADMFSYTGVPYGLRYKDRIRFRLYATRTPTEALMVFLFTGILVASWFVYPKPAFAYDLNSYVSSAYHKYTSVKKSSKKTAGQYKNIYNSNKFKSTMKTEAQKTYSYYNKNIAPKVKQDMRAFLREQGINYYSLLQKPKGQVLNSNEYIYVFMSSSVPFVVWRNYAIAIDKLRREGQGNIGIIMRGCIGGCQKPLPTMRFIFRVLTYGNTRLQVPIMIDPLLFRFYHIQRVPIFVFAKNVDIENQSLSAGLPSNLASKNITAYKVDGDCGFSYALQELYYESKDGKMLKLLSLLNKSWFEK